MAINIKANRRVDLSDFGEGWDDCYLIVKSMNSKEIEEWQESVKDISKEETVDGLYGSKLKELVVGGFIMNTSDDGTVERLEIEPADIPDVLAAMGVYFKQRAVMVAAGTYGLKGVN